VYDFFTLIEKRWSVVENATFLNKSDLEKIVNFKNLVKDEIAPILDSHSGKFIHFDAHTGNLIFNADQTFFIDWEECGFGHPLLDLAVAATHLLRDQEREEKLKYLIDGYDPNINRRELNLMTAVKLLYLMTHIPTRLDIIKEPDKIFKRYLDYFNLLS